MSMNRTIASLLIGGVSLIGNAVGQETPSKPVLTPQTTAVMKLVASMAKAEQSLMSLRMTMVTTGKLPGGLDVATRGELRVLRATQAGKSPHLFSRLQYSFGDGMKGRLETAHTDEGIIMFEEDPAFGAVFLRIAPSVVLDLEWASKVLRKSDLPGMVDSRAQSPLGSGMVRDLTRIFDLAVVEETKHGEHTGTWLRGARKAGLDAQDPDLPLADRVEIFVRGRDHAMLMARFFVGADVVQELKVEKLEVGASLGAEDFTVDGHGERIRSVQEYAPMWEQIIEAISNAERKTNQKSPSSLQKEAEAKAAEDKKAAAKKAEDNKGAGNKPGGNGGK